MDIFIQIDVKITKMLTVKEWKGIKYRVPCVRQMHTLCTALEASTWPATQKEKKEEEPQKQSYYPCLTDHWTSDTWECIWHTLQVAYKLAYRLST